MTISISYKYFVYVPPNSLYYFDTLAEAQEIANYYGVEVQEC